MRALLKSWWEGDGDQLPKGDPTAGSLQRDRHDLELAPLRCNKFQSLPFPGPWRLAVRPASDERADYPALLPAISVTRPQLAAAARPSDALLQAADKAAALR